MRLSLCVLILGLALMCGSLAESKTFLVTMKKRRGGKKAEDVARKMKNKGKKARGLKKLEIVIAEDLSDEEIEELNRDPDVQNVEPDGIVNATGCQSYTGTSLNPVTWGLDAIAHPDDNTFTTNECQPSDVVIYIFDTGIDLDHPEFRNHRASFFGKADSAWNNLDINGHGTHVAATSAGFFFGVCKRAQLKAAKVLDDDGSGFNSGIISLLDDVIQDHQNRGTNAKSVINMSLGGGFSQTMNDAVKSATEAGLVIVLAAGNSARNARNSSPASEPSAITVGSVTSSLAMSSFSNYGSVVDIFAPGSSITSARTTDISTNTRVKRARRRRKCNKRRQRKGLCTTTAPPPATTPSPATPPPVTPITPSPATPSPVTPPPITPSPATPSPDTPAPTTPSSSSCAPTSALPSGASYINTPKVTYSGTSMAAPHVAGVVANYLATFNGSPGPTPPQVETWIVNNARTGVVTGLPNGTPNRFLQVQACP